MIGGDIVALDISKPARHNLEYESETNSHGGKMSKHKSQQNAQIEVILEHD